MNTTITASASQRRKAEIVFGSVWTVFTADWREGGRNSSGGFQEECARGLAHVLVGDDRVSGPMIAGWEADGIGVHPARFPVTHLICYQHEQLPDQAPAPGYFVGNLHMIAGREVHLGGLGVIPETDPHKHSPSRASLGKEPPDPTQR